MRYREAKGLSGGFREFWRLLRKFKIIFRILQRRNMDVFEGFSGSQVRYMGSERDFRKFLRMFQSILKGFRKRARGVFGGFIVFKNTFSITAFR